MTLIRKLSTGARVEVDDGVYRIRREVGGVSVALDRDEVKELAEVAGFEVSEE